MSDLDQFQTREHKTLTAPKPSPRALQAEPAQDRPGFISNKAGTPWSGMMRGATILDNGGETYGDTDIDLNKGDTRQRVARAQEPLKDKDFYGMSTVDQMIIFDQFAYRIHQPDVVGSYFPAVVKVQNQQADLIAEGKALVMAGTQESVNALRESQIDQNTALWANRDDKGVVTDAAVIRVEEVNETTQMGLLQIQREAAEHVLGADKVAEIDAANRRGVTDLSEVDMEQRVVADLMDQAARAKLDEVGKGEDLAALEAEEERLWNEKHDGSQTDFSQAIADGNPDCSEYASLTSVSLAQSGINNMRVMGHVMHDTDFPMVGAHAYNLILDESGQNILGVFEGTATSGTFKQVMNGVSLEEFQNGATLVTFNQEAGWSTYGTGAPAEGKPLDEFIYGRASDTGYFVRDAVESADVSAIADAKMEYTQAISPEAVADQLINVYAQYGDGVRVQGWVDNIRDGTIPGDDTNPALAQAAQILHDYKGPMPPPVEIKNRIVEIVRDSQSRALANGDYDIAVTPEVIHERLEAPASNSMAADLQSIVRGLGDLNPQQIAEMSADKPWIADAAALSKTIGAVPYGGISGDSAFDRAYNGDPTYLEAYGQLASIVRNNDITPEDLKDLQSMRSYDPVVPSNNMTLGMGG